MPHEKERTWKWSEPGQQKKSTKNRKKTTKTIVMWTLFYIYTFSKRVSIWIKICFVLPLTPPKTDLFTPSTAHLISIAVLDPCDCTCTLFVRLFQWFHPFFYNATECCAYLVCMVTNRTLSVKCTVINLLLNKQKHKNIQA